MEVCSSSADVLCREVQSALAACTGFSLPRVPKPLDDRKWASQSQAQCLVTLSCDMSG